MLPDFLPPIDVKTLKKISEELNEDPERVENNVKLLKNWIKYQKYLPGNYDPIILRSFLRGCKQNLDKTKKKLDTFFIVKNTQLDLFGSIIPTYEEDLSSYKYLDVAIMPNLTPEGHRITIYKVFNPDASIFENIQIARYSTMLLMMRLHHDLHQVAGDVLIVDARNVTPSHIVKYLSNTTRKCLEVVQNASPLKLKRVIVLTNLSFVVKAVSVVKSFLKEKLGSRVYILQNHDELNECIPKKCLPSDFNGDLKSIKEYSEEMYEKVRNKGDFFKRMEMMKLNGDVPKESTITFSNEDFGVEGSFRKLNLD